MLKFVNIDKSKQLILLLIVRINGSYHHDKIEMAKKIIV